MNFIKRLFYPKLHSETSNVKKDQSEEINVGWNKHLEKVYQSIDNDKLNYPIIHFCHVLWDFKVYQNPSEIIGDSISGHWGFNEHLALEMDELEIIYDSKGNRFKLFHEHYNKITKTEFSYPSEFIKTETIETIKDRIIKGCKDYAESYCEESERENIEIKIENIKNISSIKELIKYSGKELNFYE
ncbi:hypothetical protein [Olleya sp. Bg11-27]|uniref:hypothetical protein n=1 Tax=Olleya sp. Bg11-27 TaxID=2058135 RepID=UPI000C3138E1|nr:hypothetical protein [Olleya sp. Bg11-27]AUC76291.1 hypothetical protein CW732_11695 [Olleya sp. Bg11-27]